MQTAQQLSQERNKDTTVLTTIPANQSDMAILPADDLQKSGGNW
jgi:hypothetical protein